MAQCCHCKEQITDGAKKCRYCQGIQKGGWFKESCLMVVKAITTISTIAASLTVVFGMFYHIFPFLDEQQRSSEDNVTIHFGSFDPVSKRVRLQVTNEGKQAASLRSAEASVDMNTARRMGANKWSLGLPDNGMIQARSRGECVLVWPESPRMPREATNTDDKVTITIRVAITRADGSSRDFVMPVMITLP